MEFQPLLTLYGISATVLERAGHVHPAAIEPMQVSPIGLARPSGEDLWIDPELRAAGAAHLEAVASRSPGMHDGQVLACTTITGLPLEYAPAGYFDAIATSDSLRSEYLDTSGSITGLSSLPLRALAHQAASGDPLHSGRGRVAAVGVSVAVTLPLGTARGVVLGRRNQEVATDPGMWHVAPSGTLEPAQEDAVIALVRNELSEELGIELPRPDRLEQRLRTLGVSHDLLRLRPEICLRLDLEQGDYPPDGLHLSSREFQDKDIVELSINGLLDFWSTHPPETLTSAAAGAIALLEGDEGLTPR
jgi:8-oxo-dGTP pyrophosphatase MutT (NUDIX family)